jgi:hypothetical protein
MREDTLMENPVWLCVAWGRRGGRSDFQRWGHESRIHTINFQSTSKNYELEEANASLISFVIRVRF